MVKILNEVGNVKSCKVSIGSSFNWCQIFSAGLVDPKQGGPSSAGGSPDLVAVEGVRSFRSASLLLWQWESWIPTCLCPLGYACNMPLPRGVRMRFQQKPPKHHASGGLAVGEHQVLSGTNLHVFLIHFVKAYVKGICPSTLWLSWAGRVDAYSFAYGFHGLLMSC